jgi:hypothetical protein
MPLFTNVGEEEFSEAQKEKRHRERAIKWKP